jgi:endonuclease/exonuclease/phosphatase family metal-dependent hydrolase
MRALRLPLLACAFLSASCADSPTAIESLRPEAAVLSDARSVPFTVMSRNLYLGAELTPLFTLADPAQLPFVVAALWDDVVSNDFPTRATAIAAEIAAQEPQLIGLQEVALYHAQAPGGPPVIIDYLQLLQGALRARGLDYRVAVGVDNIAVQLPYFTGSSIGMISYTLRDVILARADVQTSNPAAANYGAMLPLSVAGNPLAVPRGWTAVDATRHGRTVRFVNTHLESFHPVFNGLQAAELMGILAGEQKAVVLVGDINSGPGDPDNRPAYGVFRTAGFTDAWSSAQRDDDGFTCCFADDLSATTRTPDHRIDVVLFRQPRNADPAINHASAATLGGEPGDRVWSNLAGALLWPSDHLGLVATLQIREARPVAAAASGGN